MAEKETLDLRSIPNDSSAFLGEVEELSASEKAQITMTYWVLGAVAIIFLLSGAAYIFTDNGIEGFLSDIQSMCQVEDALSEISSEFCAKYLTEATSTINSSAKEVFEFCKNFLPPIVTLVLGAHYVTKSRNDQNS